MTMEAFIDYYETRHAPLCMKYTQGVSRYIRRFLTAHPNPETGETGELPYDVITELWFEDEATCQGVVQYLSTSIMPDEVVADEKNLFDRPKLRMATVVEFESAIPG
jgi:hypothetical protein